MGVARSDGAPESTSYTHDVRARGRSTNSFISQYILSTPNVSRAELFAMKKIEINQIGLVFRSSTGQDRLSVM